MPGSPSPDLGKIAGAAQYSGGGIGVPPPAIPTSLNFAAICL
jgi:hypothetical protein